MNSTLGAGRWTLEIPGGQWVAIALLLVFAGLWLFAMSSTRGEQSGLRRFVLRVLRSASLVWVFLLVVQPVRTQEVFGEALGRVAVLLDDSQSMSLPFGETTRDAQVRSLLKRWSAEKVRPLVFGLSKDGHPRVRSLGSDFVPDRNGSPVYESVRQLLADVRRRQLSAIVVVSDGADSTIDNIAENPEAADIRVDAIAVGADHDINDDAVAGLIADELSYVGVPALVRVQVRSTGRNAAPQLKVQLYRDDALVQEQFAAVDETGNGEAVFEVELRSPGRSLWRVSVPKRTIDQVPANNDRSFMLEARRERLRVLLVAGAPSWDVRYLRELLQADPSVDLISFFILRSPSDLTLAPASQLALIPFPTDELFREHLGSFDVVVFQNFNFGPYEVAGYLPRIRDYVLRGGSFAMVGGDNAFAQGGYAQTPIESILPVSLQGVSRDQRLATKTGRFRPRVDRASYSHPLVALAPGRAEIKRAWRGLPQLAGANIVHGAKAKSDVLLHHPSARGKDGKPLPVLSVGQPGKGRVMALLTDASWRWAFGDSATGIEQGAYSLFWDRVIRWLARDPLLEPARLTTEQARVLPGTTVKFSGVLRDKQYRPLNGTAKVRFLEQDDAVEVEIGKDGFVRGAVQAPAAPGAYKLIAEVDGDIVAEQVIALDLSGDELTEVRAFPDRLEALTRLGEGGEVHSVEDAPSLKELATTRRQSLGVQTWRPFRAAWAILLAALLLGAEWIVRRRWGRR